MAGALLRLQPDRRLAELAGEGSRPAFDELAERHRSRLVAFAGSIAPPSDADDVVQDAMLKAYLALARGDEPEHPKAWLYMIVRNTALNHRRAWRPHEELDETIDGVEQPPQAAERHGRFRSLVAGMKDLPSNQRAAIVQRELEGRGHDEIADGLGVSPAAVRQLIFRARENLRAGAAALVPMGLLRLVAMPGAVESGAGMTAAKVGVGAVLAATVLVGGDRVAEKVDGGKANQQAAAAEVADTAADAPASAAGRAEGSGTPKATGSSAPRGSAQDVTRNVTEAGSDPAPRPEERRPHVRPATGPDGQQPHQGGDGRPQRPAGSGAPGGQQGQSQPPAGQWQPAGGQPAPGTLEGADGGSQPAP